jgi:DUF971 family protein
MSHPAPTEIHLHKQSRVLDITFADGKKFSYPAEYLRVYSPSAEVQGHGPGEEVLQVGKEEVNIAHIEPVGNYAICLHFDDEHNTGIYSWDTLYKLGSNYQHNWERYLERLKAAGYTRKEPSA